MSEKEGQQTLDNFAGFQAKRESDKHPRFIRGEKVLDKAKMIINGDKQDIYGNPENSFALIADYWNTYLYSRKLVQFAFKLTAKDVAIMMTLFKIAREANQHKLDNLVDAAGYLGILGDMYE